MRNPAGLPAPPRSGHRPRPARDPRPIPRRDVPSDSPRREPRLDPTRRLRPLGWKSRPARVGHRFLGPRAALAAHRATPGTILHLPSESPARQEDSLDMRNAFLVVWWMSQVPYAAVFENRVAAEAAASVRNALLVAFKGANAEVETVVDWFRRDEEGRPMPAEWRELMGQVRLPWGTVSADRAH